MTGREVVSDWGEWEVMSSREALRRLRRHHCRTGPRRFKGRLLVPDTGRMDGVGRRHGTATPLTTLLVMLSTLVITNVASQDEASAAVNTCQVKNLTQATPARSNLQAAINAAHRGDKISVGIDPEAADTDPLQPVGDDLARVDRREPLVLQRYVLTSLDRGCSTTGTGSI
jgi:hypothetical protein